MRILVDHCTTYSYTLPAANVVQALRLTPRDHDAQYIRSWRVDTDVNGTMREGTDAFGNRLTMFYADAPLTSLTVTVTGEADVTDAHGVYRGPETLPPLVYLRSTELTRPDPAIVDMARGCERTEAIATLHVLNAAVHEHMDFDTAETDVATPAAEAFAGKSGVCQDFAHIFCAAARVLDIPARYVSGHLARQGDPAQEAAHAWAEALVPDLGWVAFDPANGICATDAYLRVAAGLDYLDAAPVRGARRGGGVETMHVHVHAADAMKQSQG
ncbi:transglutaminase family protein [Sphingomonas sp.]|jgi:transglutaminase-like putative cysteine protease|uniref:transglutaminase family protein n=1 Tax=Sphingomonas sp. TaxID=28214 RepID=UPI002DB976A3|nr:transglutaminase family protein [Sphingomonas sp.]HEU4969710.1 transglutaminase family protein [Sphingomonas sp.]